MKKFDVVAVLWDDHIAFERSTLLKSPDMALIPTLTVGFLFKETKEVVLIVSNLERYPDRDEANYLVILKSCIKGMKKYGSIELKKIRYRSD